MVSGAAALIITWVILRYSSLIMRYVGEQALGIMTKIIGLFIAAMGVESIFAGSLGWFQANMTDIISVSMSFL